MNVFTNLAEEFPQLFRIGIVSSIDEKKCTARVLFEDRDETVSHDLRILKPQTMKTKYYGMLDEKEQVFCCFMPNGQETGVIIGALYNEEDTVPIADRNTKGIWFEDGSFTKYSHETHTLTLHVKGPINIIADGNVNVTGDVIANGISLINHTHNCPDGETSPPIGSAG